MLLISYHSKHKATRKSGLLLDDNRDESEACVTRPLLRDGEIMGAALFYQVNCRHWGADIGKQVYYSVLRLCVYFCYFFFFLKNVAAVVKKKSSYQVEFNFMNSFFVCFDLVTIVNEDDHVYLPALFANISWRAISKYN